METVKAARVSAVSLSKRRARLKTIGVVVLLLGIGSACVVYWAETRSPDLKDDLSMVGYDRAQERQIGQLFGKSGVMTDKLLGDLKSPATHAAIIVGVSVVIAFGCFQYERNGDEDNEAR